MDLRISNQTGALTELFSSKLLPCTRMEVLGPYEASPGDDFLGDLQLIREMTTAASLVEEVEARVERKIKEWLLGRRVDPPMPPTRSEGGTPGDWYRHVDRLEDFYNKTMTLKQMSKASGWSVRTLSRYRNQK